MAGGDFKESLENVVNNENFFKEGANVSDIAQIKRMYANGKSAQEISDELRIKLHCVKSFEGAKADEEPAVESKADLQEFKHGSGEPTGFEELKAKKKKK